MELLLLAFLPFIIFALFFDRFLAFTDRQATKGQQLPADLRAAPTPAGYEITFDTGLTVVLSGVSRLPTGARTASATLT